MEVRLTRKIGLTGNDMMNSWTASLLNDSGQIVDQSSAITAYAALVGLERDLRAALLSVREMAGKEVTSEDT